jgi:hypothetical protein
MTNPKQPTRPDTPPEPSEDAREATIALEWDAQFAALRTLAGGELSEADAVFGLAPVSRGRAA